MRCGHVARSLPAAGPGLAVPLACAADAEDLTQPADGRSPDASHGGADTRSPDRRETANAYRGELFRTGRSQVAVCREGRQWLFQCQRPGFPAGGAAWNTRGYRLTRDGALRLHRSVRAAGARLLRRGAPARWAWRPSKVLHRAPLSVMCCFVKHFSPGQMMAAAGRIRLGEFCRIVGENRETVRSMIARDAAPFRSERPEGGQRTFGTTELIDYELYLVLKESGLGAGPAAESVRIANPAAELLSRMERGEDVELLSFSSYTTIERREDGRVAQNRAWFIGGPEEFARLMAQHNNPEFNPKAADDIGVIPALNIISLPSCYRWAKRRAHGAGYILNGRSIVKAQATAGELTGGGDE